MNDEIKQGREIEAKVTEEDRSAPAEMANAERANAEQVSAEQVSAEKANAEQANAEKALPEQAGENPEFEDLLAAVEAGEDISEQLDDPAAGEAGGGSGDETGQGAIFAREIAEVNVNAGFDPDVPFPPPIDPTANTEIIADAGAPVPGDDFIEVIPDDGVIVESGPTFGGSVIENDSFGPDGPGVPPVIAVNGDPGLVGVAVTGSLGGTLTIIADGTYEYTPPAQVDHSDDIPDSESFTYTVQDSTGDAGSATVTFNIVDTVPEIDILPAVADATPTTDSIDEGETLDGAWTKAESADVPTNVVVIFDSGEYDLDIDIDTGNGTLTVKSDGTWTFAAADDLDQGSAQSVDFSVQITDADGDVASDNHSISITDGAGPSFTGTADMTVDEDDLLVAGTDQTKESLSDDDTLTFTAGSDAIDSIVFGATDALTINGLNAGDSITWTPSGDGRSLTGAIDGTDVIQLALSGATSVAAGASDDVTVTATLLDAFPHEDAPDADSLSIDGIKIVASDDDGDSTTAMAKVTVVDDEPTLNITGGDASVTEGDSITNGTWNSDDGADTTGVTKVVFDSTEYDLDTAIDTGKGTLTVKSDGTWTFAAADDLDQGSAQSVDFSVQITDADGDVASDNHSISITDGAGPSFTGTADMTVDEDDLLVAGTDQTKESLSDDDTLTFTAGSDAIDSIVFGATDALTINGLNAGDSITWTPSGDGRSLTGAIDGTDVIQLALSGATSVAAGASDDVTVTATLLDAFPHEDAPDADSLSIDGIKIVASDDDGDSTTATAKVTVVDDEPTLNITGGDASVTEGDSITNGTWNSDDGADTTGVTKVVFDSTEYDLDTAIDTGKGTLTVKSDGTWTFAAADDLDQGSAQSVDFSVQITDADGDVASDNHSISITDGAGPSFTGTADMTVDEDDLLVAGTDQTKESLSDDDTLTFTAGSDAIDSIVFGATDALTINGLNAGDSITWTPSGDGRSLTGAIDGTDVIQLALSGATSVAAGASDDVTVTATLLDAFPHEDAPDADSLSIDGIKIVASDDDGDSTTATAKVTVVDDEPISISPEVAYVINSGSDSAVMVPLDVDSNVDDNYGADQGGTITFANIAANGTDSGQTVGGQSVYLYTNGTTLIASTLVGSDFATVSADASTQVFEVELSTDGDLGSNSDSYSVTMYQQVDGAVATFDTSNGDYAFQGGNTNYFYYFDQTGVNPAVLLTPAEDGTKINGNANEAGVGGVGPGGGGQDVGASETIRISYVDTVSGTPSQTDYVEPADHVIGDNVTVNGGFATVVSSGGSDTDLIIRAYDDTDNDYFVADGTQDEIIKVVVGGTVFTADGTLDGYTVTFNADGAGNVEVEGIPGGTQVQVFTADGFTTMEFEYLSGNTFSLGGFGATVPVPGEQINVNLDLAVADGDGDTVIVEDGINLSISPDDHTLVQGDSADNVLSTTADQAATIIGYEGDDTLSGNELNDILVGGKGSDTLSGGGESDLFVWNAGDATGSPMDEITDFNLGEGDILDLQALLVGETGTVASNNLTSFLEFSLSGTDTVIKVDVDGGSDFGTPDQTIELTGVDLVGGGTQTEIIQSLLTGGNLVTDV